MKFLLLAALLLLASGGPGPQLPPDGVEVTIVVYVESLQPCVWRAAPLPGNTQVRVECEARR